VDQILERATALANMVIGAAFLYLCSQLFHAPKDLSKVARNTFQKTLVRVIGSLLGVVALGAIIVIWTGV
jgi:hypothetical protein